MDVGANYGRENMEPGGGGGVPPLYSNVLL
jgi:hypothetical protein